MKKTEKYITGSIKLLRAISIALFPRKQVKINRKDYPVQKNLDKSWFKEVIAQTQKMTIHVPSGQKYKPQEALSSSPRFHAIKQDANSTHLSLAAVISPQTFSKNEIDSQQAIQLNKQVPTAKISQLYEIPSNLSQYEDQYSEIMENHSFASSLNSCNDKGQRQTQKHCNPFICRTFTQ